MIEWFLKQIYYCEMRRRRTIKMVPRWWLPVIHVFAVISSNLSKMSLICKPYQWYGWILTKCVSLQKKLAVMKNIEQKVNKLYSWQGGRASQLPRQEKNHQKLCYIYIPKYRKYQDSLEPIGALLSARITENLTVLRLVTIFINTCTVSVIHCIWFIYW